MKTILFLAAVALVGCPVVAQQTNEPCILNLQWIHYSPVGNKIFPSPAFPLGASADSGLPLTYQVSGPATINNGFVTLTGAGSVSIYVTQDGCNNYPACTCVWAAAPPVTINFSALDPTPVLATPRLVDGLFRITVKGLVGQKYSVESSQGFNDWLEEATGTTSSIGEWSYTPVLASDRRFFRARFVP